VHLPADTASVPVVSAASTAGSVAGGMVALPVIAVIIVLIVYLCRHRRHKITTALLGFVTGVLLSGTVLGAAMARASVE
jgi:hypothetical protein